MRPSWPEFVVVTSAIACAAPEDRPGPALVPTPWSVAAPPAPEQAAWERHPADQEGAAFGIAAASAGDVDGDGFDDVVVAAPLLDLEGAVDGGRVWLFRGSPRGLQRSPSWRANAGDGADARFGHAVAGLGDTNGDGFDDVAIGAPSPGPSTPPGRVVVVLGSADGLADAPSWISPLVADADVTEGWSVAGAGDVNGDGFDDLLAGAPNDGGVDPDEGSARLWLGPLGETGRAADWDVALTGRAAAHFGGAVASAGDVDGDGFDDVVVGAEDHAVRGAVFLYAGGPAGLPTAPTWQWLPEDGGLDIEYGAVVASAGDVDADGHDDLLVSCHQCSVEAAWDGRAALYRGSRSGPLWDAPWTVTSGQAGARLGEHLAGVGDVDGDGYDDVVIAAPDFDADAADEGRVQLYLGGPDGLSPTPAWEADPTDEEGARFGSAVAAAGDVNGDGFADVLVGASGQDGEAVDEGRLYLYLGCPGTEEVAGDAVDEDCDGFVACLLDDDRDGFAPEDAPTVLRPVTGGCRGDATLASPDVDCDDGSSRVHPGAREVPGDGVDQDCDGSDLPLPAETDPPRETDEGDSDASDGTGEQQPCGCDGAGGAGAGLGLVLLALRRRARR